MKTDLKSEFASEHTNALAEASSSYLRSAMHQPINWREWGQDAFEQAKSEDKPVLLDIGAVWCHWCHVMDRESYDNPEIAQIINQHFIAVKVDRDERPDVDSRYQAAVSSITGQGGWPLTAFLTSDGKPFFGGTYFPPTDNFGRPSFKRVLLAIAEAYREKRADVDEQANMVMSVVGSSEALAGHTGERVSPQVIDHIIGSAQSMFDPRNGGFGNQPKFPHPAALDVLLHRYTRTGDPDTSNISVTTLQKMARGGIYDQLAGGFHRYSVDEHWIVPHFEKMSYDNSELLKNYVHAYQATAVPFFDDVAKDIIRWIDEWLSDRQRGGFYASQDADFSMDDDGDYFTWTLDEARAVLGQDELQVASLHYDINEVGEMHHNPAKNVLYVRAPIDEIAVRTGMPSERVSTLLDSAKKKMYAARLKRPTPYVDKTVYVGWNGLCISAYLQAAEVLALADARAFALKSLDRILREGWDAQQGLKHVITYSEANASQRDVRGVLDDYAFTALACLDAYEATADMKYFAAAQQITDAMIDRFYDRDGGGFFDAPANARHDALGALAAPRKPFQDSPTPAGNSAAAIACLRLYGYTNQNAYHRKAEETLELFAGLAEQIGIFAGTYAIATVWYFKPHTQVVIVGDGQPAAELYAAAVAPFALNKAVICLAPHQVRADNLPPALADTIPALPGINSGQPLAIICSNFTCQPPISDAAELAKVLRETVSR